MKTVFNKVGVLSMLFDIPYTDYIYLIDYNTGLLTDDTTSVVQTELNPPYKDQDSSRLRD